MAWDISLTYELPAKHAKDAKGRKSTGRRMATGEYLRLLFSGRSFGAFSVFSGRSNITKW
jgi:hypothetical protein